MAREQKTENFAEGVQNKIPAEVIADTAASSELGWLSRDGVLELTRGRRIIGSDGALGGVQAEIWAAKLNGDKVHFVKKDTEIGYFDEDEVYHTTISGLTPGSYYTFSVYHSLAGAFLYATGPDGLFKIAVANPGSYKDMFFTNPGGAGSTAPSNNYLGWSIVNDRRMILWHKMADAANNNFIENYTTLFLSKIDPQDGTNYQEGSDSMGTGNGTETTFTGTLSIPQTGQYAKAFGFGVKVFPAYTSVAPTISGITKATIAVVDLSDRTGIAIGDWLYFSGISGMTEMNGVIAQVISTGTGAGFVAVDWDTTTYTTYTSGGTARRYEAPIYDDGNGGFIGMPGTINYATGAFSITLPTPQANGVDIRSTYLYEDSNQGGITDFSTDDVTDNTQGIAITQEFLGEPIQFVLVFEGKYYSFKESVVYELAPAVDWSSYTNVVYRSDIGIPSLRSAISTGKGMVYMDTANPSDPKLTILQRNTVGGNLDPINLTPLFKWSDYLMDNCVVDTWDEYIIVSAQTVGGDENDTTFLVNTGQKYSTDVIPYGASTFAKNGYSLYCGSPSKDTVYEIFTGFDDLGGPILNAFEGKAKNYGTEDLKRVRFLRLKGIIDPSQSYEAFAQYDGGDWTLLGTVRGDAPYVDYTNPETIGNHLIGEEIIGGGTAAIGYPYLTEIPLREPKFRTRTLRFVANGIGYVSIQWTNDYDILLFENKLPVGSRQQNWPNLAGTSFDNPTFQS